MELTIIKTDGTEETVTVNGDEFGQEESSGWSKDDDGEWNASYIFIAFRDDFDLKFRFTIHGNQIIHDKVDYEPKNFDEFEISSVKIDEVELEPNIKYLLSFKDEDY